MSELLNRGQIYVGASRVRKDFLDSVMKVAEKNSYSAVFSPWNSGSPLYETLLEKIRDLLSNSHLIILDFTMENKGSEWFMNYGVWTEYSMAAALKRMNRLVLFANEASPMDKLHPFVNKEIRKYSLATTEGREQFEREVNEQILKFDRSLNDVALRSSYTINQSQYLNM